MVTVNELTGSKEFFRDESGLAVAQIGLAPERFTVVAGGAGADMEALAFGQLC